MTQKYNIGNTFQPSVPMTKDELLQSISELSTPDLKDFVTQVLLLRAKRRSPSITSVEN